MLCRVAGSRLSHYDFCCCLQIDYAFNAIKKGKKKKYSNLWNDHRFCGRRRRWRPQQPHFLYFV